MRAGGVKSLLFVAPVGDPIERARRELKAIQQSTSLCRRAVGRESLALALFADECFAQILSDPFDVAAERFVSLGRMDAPFSLAFDERWDTRIDLAIRFRSAGENSQRPAVNLQFLDVLDRQSLAAEKSIER